MTIIILISIGILIGYTGVKLILNQDLSKMNYTQYQYVKQENISQFSKNAGIALLILALSFILSGIVYIFIPLYNYIILLIGFISYAIILLKNQKKYNAEPDDDEEK